MNYLVTGTLTHSFNWWACSCDKPPEVMAWGGEVSLTPTEWSINLAPLPVVTWQALSPPAIGADGVWFKAIDAAGSFATFAGEKVTYSYTQHHGDGWEAHGVLVPVPEPSIVGLVVLGYSLMLLVKGGKRDLHTQC